MKKIILISLFTPTYNNIGGASALPYHLIKGANEIGEFSFEIYSFNYNNVSVEQIQRIEIELNVNIHAIEKPKWMTWMFRYRIGFIRVFLKYPHLAYLHLPKKCLTKMIQSKAEAIWIYGEELSKISFHFPNTRCLVSMPDCESLFYYRMLNLSWNANNLIKQIRYIIAYYQYRKMERLFYNSSTLYHFVGKADADFFHLLNPNSNVHYLPHPHYDYKDRVISFHKPKIKVLFAGRYDLYCKHGSDMVLNALISHANDFRKEYEITFLGKDWDVWKNKLDDAGYKVNHINYAPDYIEELHRHDIQINAIDVGTGTKGKVLDAFANGLLVIGTPFALENIETDDSSSIRFSTPDEFVTTLYDIPRNILKYEQMAEFGRKNILKHHDRHIISKQLFN